MYGIPPTILFAFPFTHQRAVFFVLCLYILFIFDKEKYVVTLTLIAVSFRDDRNSLTLQTFT